MPTQQHHDGHQDGSRRNEGEGDRTSDRHYREKLALFLERNNPTRLAEDAARQLDDEDRSGQHTLLDADAEGRSHIAEEDPEVTMVGGSARRHRADPEVEDADADILMVIEERARAVRAKDLDALMALYAPDVVTFDVVDPLMNAGVDAVRARAGTWLASFASPIEYHVEDVRLAATGDVAFDYHLTQVQGTNRGGDKIDMWFRETIGYRKVGGRWLVTHQHSSVPFSMATGKASDDLQP